MDHKDKLEAKIAVLESKVDYLESEIGHIDQLLLRCGFPDGLETLRETVEEILKEGFEMPQARPARFLDI